MNTRSRAESANGAGDAVRMSPGKAIRVRRQAMGLGQEELAHKLDVTQNTISKWEQRNGPPPAKRRESLAKVLHVSMDDLMGGLVPRHMVEPDMPWSNAPQAASSRPPSFTNESLQATSASVKELADDLAYIEQTSPQLFKAACVMISLLREDAQRNA